MTDKELFKEVLTNLQHSCPKLKMSGTLVYYDGEARFNTDGFILGYNLFRLTKMLDDEGMFM